MAGLLVPPGTARLLSLPRDTQCSRAARQAGLLAHTSIRTKVEKDNRRILGGNNAHS